MASGTKVKKHKCSCGRSFRHAISLKRHQNVTGCDGLATEEVKENKKLEAPSEVETQETLRNESDDDRTIVITPELVASWQAQTGFQRRPGGFIDQIESAPATQKVDWSAVAETGKEFLNFCLELKRNAVKASQSVLVVLGRSALFFSVLFCAGWFLVSNVSASVSNKVDDVGRSQLAAQTVVQDFLQNAQLNHYQRARRLLAPSARASVTAEQLQMMFNSLPLDQSPASWSTELSDDCKSARVVLSRAGMSEIYTLVQSDTGWGLSSVSIANS